MTSSSSKRRPHYDLALILNQTVQFESRLTDWRRILGFPRLAEILRHIDSFTRREKLEIFIERHPYFDGYFARRAVYMNETRRTFLNRMAGLPYGGDRLGLAAAMREDLAIQGPYVTVHNGYDTNIKIKGGTGRHTKCWPHFPELVALLKRDYPGVRIVQLGSSTSVPIPGVDHDLIDKTSFAEVGAILGKAIVHFDNDSGLVHMAAALGTPSVVMFGPTLADFYGYPGNRNLAPSVCGGCWWTVSDWMDVCARGFEKPLCLESTSAERALDAARERLIDAASHRQADFGVPA